MSNAFDLVRLPDDIEQGAKGGPEFQTTITTLATGIEQRNVDWPTPRIKWDISYGMQSKDDYQRFTQFFRARYGRARGFLFKDWSDYSAANVNIGTGQDEVRGTPVPPAVIGPIITPQRLDFQLYKYYTDGTYSTSRKITRPVASTVKVYVDGVQKTTGWTLISGGIIRFNTLFAPHTGEVVTATFEFDVPVRFDSDYAPLTMTWEDAATVDAITIVEIKE